MPIRLRHFRLLRPLAYVGVLGLSVVAFSSSSSFLGNAAIELANRNAASPAATPREINVPSTPTAPSRVIRPGFDPDATAPPIAAIDPRAGTQPDSSTTTIGSPATTSSFTTLPPPGPISTATATAGSTLELTAPLEEVAAAGDEPGDDLGADSTPADLPMPADIVGAPALDTAAAANAVEPARSDEPAADEGLATGQPFIAVTAVNIHTRPANGSPRVGTLARGEEVMVLADEQGWLQVAADGQVMGWVYHTFLAAR